MFMELIAHRGAPGKGDYENTLGAFDKALAAGVYAVECDVVLTRDGEPVVIHPKSFYNDNLAPYFPEEKASAIDWSELQQLKFPDGITRIPHLREVLQLVKQKVGRCFLEPKSNSRELIEAMVEEVQNQDMQDQVIFVSFYARKRLLQIVKQLDNKIRCVAVFLNPFANWAKSLKAYRFEICILHDARLRFLRMSGRLGVPFREKVTACQKQGSKVFVEFADNPDQMKWAASIGVDGFVSNNLETLARET